MAVLWFADPSLLMEPRPLQVMLSCHQTGLWERNLEKLLASLSTSNHTYLPTVAASFHVKALMFCKIQLSHSLVLFTPAEVECIRSTLGTFHLPALSTLALLELTDSFPLVVLLTCGFVQPGAEVAFHVQRCHSGWFYLALRPTVALRLGWWNFSRLAVVKTVMGRRQVGGQSIFASLGVRGHTEKVLGISSPVKAVNHLLNMY